MTGLGKSTEFVKVNEHIENSFNEINREFGLPRTLYYYEPRTCDFILRLDINSRYACVMSPPSNRIHLTQPIFF